jgi:hypothetical protein
VECSHEGFWPTGRGSQLFYASLDLEKFYPSVKTTAVLRGISENIEGFEHEPELRTLLERMLSFRVGKNRSANLRSAICQPLTKPGNFSGIPTGLMVAGFLSNVAMLPLDLLIDSRVRKGRKIAHFDLSMITLFWRMNLAIWSSGYNLTSGN